MGDQESGGNKPPERPSDSQVVILPPEAVKQAAETGLSLQVVIASSRHSGPLPAPATLRGYEEIVPGLPAVLVDEFKRESAHRRKVQNVGQFGAIVIALSAIAGGIWLGYFLGSALAAFAVVGPVCGVVGIAQFLEFWLKAK